MKKKIKLSKEEIYTLLQYGNLVSIPKNPEERNSDAYFDDSIKRIKYIQHLPTVFLQDKNNWYTIDKKDLPEFLQEEFFHDSILIDNYKLTISNLVNQLDKIPKWIRNLFGLNNISNNTII